MLIRNGSTESVAEIDIPNTTNEPIGYSVTSFAQGYILYIRHAMMLIQVTITTSRF